MPASKRRGKWMFALLEKTDVHGQAGQMKGLGCVCVGTCVCTRVCTHIPICVWVDRVMRSGRARTSRLEDNRTHSTTVAISHLNLSFLFRNVGN